MINKIAEELIDDVFRHDELIAKDTIEKHPNWVCLLVDDMLDNEQLEGLVNELNKKDITKLIGVNFNYPTEIIDLEEIDVKKEKIDIFLTKVNVCGMSILTTEEKDFLYFYSDEITFYALCGSAPFVENTVGITLEEGKNCFLANWEKNINHPRIRQEYDIRLKLWNIYSKTN